MEPVQFMVTTAGLNALVDASGGGTDPILVTSVGITEAAFTMAPTVSALPGELKRLTAISGAAVSETIIHMTAQDSSTDIYELRGLGLYLADGTLFAVYSQSQPLFRKVSIAFFLLALDIAFQSGNAGDIAFGDATFLFPPATETVKGVAEIATPAEAAGRADHERFITALTLGQQLAAERGETEADLTALAEGFDTLLTALIARTISGGGLISGGGNLSASRILTVLAASAAEVAQGLITDKAVTPASLAGITARTIMGGGLVTGGGDLTDSRTLTVTAATAAEAAAGLANDKAVTPAALVGALNAIGGWSPDVFRIPGTPAVIQIGEFRGTYTTEAEVTITLPMTYPNACLYAGPISYISASGNLRDMFVQMRERSPSYFSVYLQAPDASDNRIDGFDWIAIGY